MFDVISDIIHHFAAKFKYNSKNVESGSVIRRFLIRLFQYQLSLE